MKAGNADKLPDTIPGSRERGITYDVDADTPPPPVGGYLVTVCKGRKPGTVYCVVSCRRVNGKYPFRYALRVVSCPDLLPHARIVGFRFNVFISTPEGQLWAYPIIWNRRRKKGKC